MNRREAERRAREEERSRIAAMTMPNWRLLLDGKENLL